MLKRFMSVCLAALALASMLLITLSPATARAAGQAQGQPYCANQLGLVPECPIPLRFPRGAYGISVHGTMRRNTDQRFYTVAARAGQRMTISFLGAGRMRGNITFPEGGYESFNGEGDTVQLRSNGVYRISLAQAGASWRGSYTLSVMVR
jgi:nucleoside recognition membrane protein YjiH